jgi:hypothetical protein
MTEKSNHSKPHEQFTIGAFIVTSLLSGGVKNPRDAHAVGDFDISMIPDFAFWPFENGGFISEVSHGQWGALIERLEGIGKNLLLDKASDSLGGIWERFKGYACGDPHNVSFRGAGFDFQARGEFTYARVGSGDSEFRIDVRHHSIGNHAAFIGAVAVKLGSLVIEVDAHRLNPTIAGQPVGVGMGAAGLKTTSGKFVGMLVGQRNCFQIVDQSLNVVQIDRSGDHLDLYVMLNAVRAAAEASGVLGNPMRGLLHLDGTPLPTTVSTDEFRRFASDWAVRADQTLFTDKAFVAFDPKFPERFLTVADLDKQTRTRAESLSRERLGNSADAFMLESCIYDVGFAGESYRNSYGFHGLPPVASRLVIKR